MNRSRLHGQPWGMAALALALIALAGCQRSAGPPARPPAAVTVVQPIQREVVRWDRYSSYLSSPETATVNARVSGLIVSAPFKEGALVHTGDLLFKIDPRPFQADLDNKKAAVSEAKAAADKAQADYNRYAKLLAANVVARADYDTYKASFEEARASLQATEAALETSRLNLDWTDVRAPISGRVSKMNVTVGNLVTGGSTQATALTTIVSVDPLYCYINVPQATALRYRKMALQEHQADVGRMGEPCYVQLENEPGFSHKGFIDFVDNQVDLSTGTVQMRCVIPNPTGLLTAGLYGVARIAASAPYQALLVPDAAINADQNERYLLLVGPGDVAERQQVQLGALFGNLRAISQGLQGNARVIVSGLQSVMPGTKVEPREAPEPQLSAWSEGQSSAAGLPETDGD